MAAIFIRTLIIYVLIALSIRIMGKRQIGELDVSELVCTLLVSEIASLPIADRDIPLLNAVIPLILIVCLEIIISFIKNKSERLKRIIEGVPAFIIYKGRLRQSVLSENRISVNELLCELRTQGVASIDEVYYAILEQNGKISVIKNDDGKKMAHTIITDGEVDKKSLAALGHTERWLGFVLEKNGICEKDVFLLTVDDCGKTNIIRKEQNEKRID